ncbi:MAG TPA: glycosyltransferase, partial [Candidatus Polarisedimenticolaceae bacterium]|nr:glycosyltransferase [Candidatus Polarisedimenticolaceae bacterium]
LLRIPRLTALSGIRPGFSWKKLASDGLMAAKVLPLVRRERYDLVHAVEESAFLARALKAFFGIPYVYDMDSSLAHQMMEKYGGLRAVAGWLQASERHAIRHSVGVIAVCRALQDLVQEGAPGKLVARIEDVSLLRDDASLLDPPLPEAPRPVVMYVGNLERYQGIDLLMEGWADAVRRGAPGTLVIVGGAEAHVAHYRRRAEAAGMGDRVRFAGPRPVGLLGAVLAAADVLVSPRTLGFNTPMKIYSYLDSGKPIVATRLPTHTQVLDDAIAVLCEPAPAAFGAALHGLLTDPPRAARIGAAGRARARAEYTPEAFRRKVLAFYGAVQEQLRVR